MSETHDPWARVRALRPNPYSHENYYVASEVDAARAAEATQRQQELIDLRANYAQSMRLSNDTLADTLARLAAVEAERDRLQRVNECVYEVCGCGNMADAHCMICCRPLTEHRLIPTRELAEIQRRFALYAEDLAERDRLKAALSQLDDWLRSFSMPPTSTIAEKEAALVFIAAALEGTAKP